MSHCQEKGCKRKAVGVTVPFCDFHAYAREQGEEKARAQLAANPAGEQVRKTLAGMAKAQR